MSLHSITTDPSTTTDFDENLSSIDPNANFYFLPNGIGKDRRTIFTNAFERLHLQLVSSPENARYIIVDDQFDVPKVFSILKINPTDIPDVPAPIVIRTKWLSDSLKDKRLIPLTKEYIIRPPLIRKKAAPSFTQQPATEEKVRPKRRLSTDEPQGGSATQVKQRRYSSDDEDYNIDEVSQSIDSKIEEMVPL